MSASSGTTNVVSWLIPGNWMNRAADPGRQREVDAVAAVMGGFGRPRRNDPQEQFRYVNEFVGIVGGEIHAYNQDVINFNNRTSEVRSLEQIYGLKLEQAWHEYETEKLKADKLQGALREERLKDIETIRTQREEEIARLRQERSEEAQQRIRNQLRLGETTRRPPTLGVRPEITEETQVSGVPETPYESSPLKADAELVFLMLLVFGVWMW